MLYRLLLNSGFFLLTTCLVACQTLTPTVLLSPEAALEQGKQDFKLGDYTHAYAELQPLAKAGNPEAQYALGYMQYYGLGTPQDRAEARDWTQKAALQGYPAAQHAMQEFNKQLIRIQPVANVQNATASKQTAPAVATNHYILQLMASHDEAALRQWAGQKELTNTHIVQSTHEGKPWYVLTIGDYESRALAEMAAQQIRLKDASLKPWVRLNT